MIIKFVTLTADAIGGCIGGGVGINGDIVGATILIV